jgi:hypothetical protein
MEWGSSSLTRTPANLVHSSAGDSFDGALVGPNLVMFKRSWPATFTGMTYPASGASTHYISDLMPNTSYRISGSGAPANATTDSAGVLTFAADGTGNIIVGFSPPSVVSITVTSAGASLVTGGTLQYAATCNYSDMSSVDCTSTATWSDTNTAAATISSHGLASAVGNGSTTILAVSNGIVGSAELTVSGVGATQQGPPPGMQSSPSTQQGPPPGMQTSPFTQPGPPPGMQSSPSTQQGPPPGMQTTPSAP